MPYMPPFVVPAQPQVFRQGMRPLGTTWKVHNNPMAEYYAAAPADPLAAIQGTPTVEIIEQFAPSVAKLLAGLTPEEQVEVLNAKIKNLQKYTNMPVVGLLAQDKIVEYSARLKALDKMAAAERLKRNIILIGLSMAGLVGASMAFYYLSRARQVIKETDDE